MSAQVAKGLFGLNNPANVPEQANGLKDRFSRIESFLQRASSLMATQMKSLEDARQSLETTVALLEAQLKEKEEILLEKDTAQKELVETFGGRIQELESTIKERDRLLENHEEKPDDGQPKNEEETTLKKAEDLMLGEIRQLEEIKANWELGMAALAAQLRLTEKELDLKDATLKGITDSLDHLGDSLMDQIGELEKRLKKLEGRS